jgi:hypothetical protein
MNTRREFLKNGAAAGLAYQLGLSTAEAHDAESDLILTNGRFATLDRSNPNAEAVAIKDGRFSAVGSREEVGKLRAKQTIDLRGHTVIPGLNDSHIHLIRGGLNYNLELRWDGVPSLADGLRMLKEQAARTPAPQWVRVVGGWSEYQFAERRMPTLEEVNAAARRHRSLSCTSTIAHCSTAPPCAQPAIRRRRRTLSAARSSVTRMGIRLGCSLPGLTQRSSTRPSLWGQNSLRSIRRTRRGTSCAS